MVTAKDYLQKTGSFTENVVGALVDDVLVDLHTPLEEGFTKVAPITTGDPKALEIIRHSSAHVMADAVQRLFPGTKVTFGPATETGFYYDFDRPGGSFSEDELQRIEDEMRSIIEQDHPFRREVLKKEQARHLLQSLGESYKLEHLERLDDPISIYRHGDWVDLCKGPHVPSTRFLGAFRLTAVSGAYWRGDERNPMLQRIYGTAFANEKDLRRYLTQLEERKKRDHRILGKELNLFFFHPFSAASPFFLPRGATVYNGLVHYVRDLYHHSNYQEVVTPQLFDPELFRISGHLPEYADNMFFATGGAKGSDQATVDTQPAASVQHITSTESPPSQPTASSQVFGIKPMNCPAHALMFSMRRRSYRELPMRIADFGRLHRYERSGTLQGLTRVRTFAQDDAHIFCTEEQLQPEMRQFLATVLQVYEDFAFSDVRVVIATRPDSRLGDDALWTRAEEALEDAVKAEGLSYEIAEGEGAFYGPKIEFHLRDALDRSWQLGTVQVDFNLPERFDLKYVGSDNQTHRPVMLHRAILGSLERFLAVLLEHCAGAFPLWLAPEHIAILTVSDESTSYAERVAMLLRERGLRVLLDVSPEKLGAKIRQARLVKIPYLGIIGAKEASANAVALRSREQGELGSFGIDQLCQKLVDESRPSFRRIRADSKAANDAEIDI